ncbi:DEAD/DEAH box helicase [Roseovarius sp. EL26]|uniref:DEAD/DEAH box helicase n=1 Tax=Roseovarius sp. EL26 TaxID=2126672 RepID=UPI000EA06A21|nr:DEAD/DEAH box helicase [Roseovarius sp. EL26]
MNFEELGLKPRLVAQLAAQGITEPTPIQYKAIPLALDGRDIMGLAQTGTGKTAAFALPLIDAITKMGTKPAPKSSHGLILAPTRELAKQIQDNIIAMTKGAHISTKLIVGGVSLNRQVEVMRKGADLVVATPGRLIDLIERKAVDLGQTRFLVLDEADQMLDLGFIHALRRIAPLLRKERQTMLFSATMPKQMAELSTSYLTSPVRVEVARPGLPVAKIQQSVHFVAQKEKYGLLRELLSTKIGERAIVFSRTKHGAEKMMKNLERDGFKAGSIHGNKSQGQRDRAIKAFKDGQITVLVATDVAARGIDISDVKYVFNFDLPNVAENYVHRIGRTARAGAEGEAIAFCSTDEVSEFKAIQKVLKADIPVASGTVWAELKDAGNKKPGGGRGGPGRNRRRGGGGGHSGGGNGGRGHGGGNGGGGNGGGGRRRRAA